MGWFKRESREDSPSEAKEPRALLELVNSPEQLNLVFEAPRAVLYKHSTRCGVCVFTLEEVRRLAADHPDLPVYVVDVHTGRAASDEMARRSGVRHESPQAFVLAEGRVLWAGSHNLVTAANLGMALAGRD